MGTVIRPRKESKDGNYDLDILAITKTLKSETTPRQVKESIGQVPKFSDRYRSKLAKEDVHCLTLQYAEDSAGLDLILIWFLQQKNLLKLYYLIKVWKFI